MKEWIEEENIRFTECMKPLGRLTVELYDELRRSLPTGDQTLEYPDGPYRYFSRALPGRKFPLFLRRRDGEVEETILDINENFERQEFVSLHVVTNSPDHRYLLYGLDRDGSERFSLLIKDLTRPDDQPEVIHNAAAEVCWLAGSDQLLYVGLDGYGRPNILYKHVLGTDPIRDEVLYQDTSGSLHLSLSLTESRRFIVLTIASHDAQDIRLIDSKTGELSCSLTWLGETHAVTDYHDHILALTSSADGWQVLLTDTAPGQDHHLIHTFDSDVMVHSMKRFGSWLAFAIYQNALSRIFVLNVESGHGEYLQFADEVYEVDLLPQKEYQSSRVLIRYSSFTTPTVIFSCDLDTGERVKVKEPFLGLHDFNSSEFITRRTYAQAQDGVMIPVTLAGSREAFSIGRAPLLLYVYGAYGSVSQVAFNPYLIPLLRRGFIYGIAHVRGGGEFGDSWHAAGRGRRKETSLSDYEGTIRSLVNSDVTYAGGVTAIGESAGALVAAGCLVRDPSLFRCLILRSPFLDVVGALSDAEQRLTPSDIAEFGDPQIPEDREIMESYSPQSRLDFNVYPPIYISCGDTDTRVPFAESLHWIRKVRKHSLLKQKHVVHAVSNRGHELYQNDEEAAQGIAKEYSFLISAYAEEAIS